MVSANNNFMARARAMKADDSSASKKAEENNNNNKDTVVSFETMAATPEKESVEVTLNVRFRVTKVNLPAFHEGDGKAKETRLTAGSVELTSTGYFEFKGIGTVKYRAFATLDRRIMEGMEFDSITFTYPKGNGGKVNPAGKKTALDGWLSLPEGYKVTHLGDLDLSEAIAEEREIKEIAAAKPWLSAVSKDTALDTALTAAFTKAKSAEIDAKAKSFADVIAAAKERLASRK